MKTSSCWAVFCSTDNKCFLIEFEELPWQWKVLKFVLLHFTKPVWEILPNRVTVTYLSSAIIDGLSPLMMIVLVSWPSHDRLQKQIEFSFSSSSLLYLSIIIIGKCWFEKKIDGHDKDDTSLLSVIACVKSLSQNIETCPCHHDQNELWKCLFFNFHSSIRH